MNFALHRPASQSSIYPGIAGGNGGANKAVDGIAENDESFSHTKDRDNTPWWKVQLAYPIWVTHVEITNRIANGQ